MNTALLKDVEKPVSGWFQNTLLAAAMQIGTIALLCLDGDF